MIKTFTIIGGDQRQTYVANSLVDKGYQVYSIYSEKNTLFSDKVIKSIDVKKVFDISDVIIFPLPITIDGETIKTPFSDKTLNINDCLKYINKNTIVFGGKVSKQTKDKFNCYDIDIIDYLKRDEFGILNAVPTAEGAIDIAIKEKPYTIYGSKCLVTGYGNISKVLSRILKSMGADVYVSARKFRDLAAIKVEGYHSIAIKDIDVISDKIDIFFNTVPAVIFNDSVLKNINKNSLIIDLASVPGGVDFKIAEDIGIKVIWALSLPGKIAPVTAGEIITLTILNILTERGEFDFEKC